MAPLSFRKAYRRDGASEVIRMTEGQYFAWVMAGLLMFAALGMLLLAITVMSRRKSDKEGKVRLDQHLAGKAERLDAAMPKSDRTIDGYTP